MKIVTVALALILISGSAAQAQTTFASVQPAGLPTVYVVDRAGTETKGRLVSITESLVSIDVNGATKTFTADEVSLIERKGDSLKNGAIIGTLIGAAGGLLTWGLADCPSGDHSCTGARFALVLLNTGLYAAVGTGIDAAISGRTRIWPRKGHQTSGLVVSASPATRGAFIGWRLTR